MKGLEDFLNQELEPWIRIPMGHAIGAVGLLCLFATAFIGRAFIIDLFNYDYGERFVSGTFLLISSLLSLLFLRTAYRLIKNKP